MLRKLKIQGSGIYLPKRIVKASETAERLGVDLDWVSRFTGIEQRHFAEGDETTSFMAAEAIKKALEKAGWQAKDLDLIVCASGVPQQAIPCTAAFVQKHLGLEESGIPCFDINSTCLSFVVALDHLSTSINAGIYKKVALVSSDISSVGLNWKDRETASLFGDGAAAVMLEASPLGSQGVVCSRVETYSWAVDSCLLEGGGSLIHPSFYSAETADRFYFKMNGKKIFKAASQVMEAFLDRLLSPMNMKIQDFKCILPHQASMLAMEAMKRKLELTDDQLMNIIPNHGNMIAASIPTALHYAIQEKRIGRGEKVLLVGTSAGFSVGALVLEY